MGQSVFFKDSLFVLIVLMFLSSFTHAQQNGFVQVYSSFEDDAAATLVTETNDGYTAAGYSDQYFILKTDKKGNPLTLKLFRNNMNLKQPLTQIYSPIIQTQDHGFLMIDTDSAYSNTYQGLRLIKTDEDADLLWNITVDPSVSFKRFGLLEAGDSSIYIALRTDIDKARLIKVNKEGGLLWSKDADLIISLSVGINIKELSNGDILLAGFRDFLIVDPAGNIVNQINLSGMVISALAVTENDELIISYDSLLVKTDLSGNMIWTKDISFRLSDIFETSDGGFFGLQSFSGSRMIKFDSNGEHIWHREVNSFIQSAVQTSDDGFIWAGNHLFSSDNPIKYSNLPVVIKTDPEGSYTAAALSFPFKQLHASVDYKIEWLLNNVPYINIDFSTDGGSTWEEVVQSLSTEGQRYKWTAPFSISDNCLLRIQASDNPSVSDQSDSAFSIMPPYNSFDKIAVNEVKMWINNYGFGSHDPYTEGQGFFWPGGEDAVKGAVFQDGLLWGGKVNGEIRVGGSTYRSGLQPGNIKPDGTPADSGSLSTQVWKIRKDWQDLPPGILRDLNEYNYNHWPVGTGIPWLDANQDGKYSPGIDHPVIYGDEMLFNAVNDFDTTNSRFLYGSDPMGLEVQCITFARDTTTGLKDAVFKKYKLINKSAAAITDMYLAYWTDDDMGDANDDLVGVDTVLNLGYSWNGNENDLIYGNPPPALGHMIIQGPIVPASTNDSARYDRGWKKGYRNLPATSFVFYLGGGAVYSDADLGVYDGTLQIYNNMNGLLGDGSSPIDPISGEAVKFIMAGDPVSGTGWYDDDGWPGGPSPGDRRYLISSGPFNLAPGDTQEIGIAIFMALGDDRFRSITALREKVPVLKDYYDNELVEEPEQAAPVGLTDYYLSQNYPNPFNSTTNIEYTLPEESIVTIKIYDILGREVTTLKQGEQVPWHYKVSFNASSLASGVYLYRIEAIPVNGQGGNFLQTKKMVLLK